MVMYWWWDRRRKVDYGRVVLVTVHHLVSFHRLRLCSQSQWEDAPVKINFQGPVTSLHSPQMVMQDNIFCHLSGTFNLLLHIERKYWMEHLAVVPGSDAAELKWNCRQRSWVNVHINWKWNCTTLSFWQTIWWTWFLVWVWFSGFILSSINVYATTMLQGSYGYFKYCYQQLEL